MVVSVSQYLITYQRFSGHPSKSSSFYILDELNLHLFTPLESCDEALWTICLWPRIPSFHHTLLWYMLGAGCTLQLASRSSCACSPFVLVRVLLRMHTAHAVRCGLWYTCRHRVQWYARSFEYTLRLSRGICRRARCLRFLHRRAGCRRGAVHRGGHVVVASGSVRCCRV